MFKIRFKDEKMRASSCLDASSPLYMLVCPSVSFVKSWKKSHGLFYLIYEMQIHEYMMNSGSLEVNNFVSLSVRPFCKLACNWEKVRVFKLGLDPNDEFESLKFAHLFFTRFYFSDHVFVKMNWLMQNSEFLKSEYQCCTLD